VKESTQTTKYLSIRELQSRMVLDGLQGASKQNIYKRVGSGLDWGIEEYRGMYRISIDNYLDKWVANPPFKKMGRPVIKPLDSTGGM